MYDKNLIYDIALEDIEDDVSFNCRGPIAPIDVADLAKDIEQKGLIQPVTIAPMIEHESNKKFFLVAGYRRFLAHRVIGRNTIRAIINEDFKDHKEAMFFNLAENVQRKDLSILQEARAIAKLKELGVSRESTANRLGKSQGWVQIRYMLLDLPVEVQAEVDAGFITQPQIRQLHSIHQHFGTESTFKAVRQLKDAKIKGLKGTDVSPKKTNPNLKRHRKRVELFTMMEHIRTTVGGGLHLRTLAWAAGEISTMDLYVSISEYAKAVSIPYTIPESEPTIIIKEEDI